MIPSFSFWEQNSFFKYDILIAGSGIVGFNAAIHLKSLAPHLQIAVIERGFLPSGASTKNAGFACFGSLSELCVQRDVIGEERLLKLVEKRWKGLTKLRTLLGDSTIDYQNNGSYELFLDDSSIKAENYLDKIDYFNQLLSPIFNHSSIFSREKSKVEYFGFKKVNQLIYNSLEAQIDTGKMMKALWMKAASMGIQVLNSCELLEIIPEENKIRIITDKGQFQCKKVLLATNAFTKKFFPELDVVPGRGQVIVTKPIENLKLKGTFHFDEGYYYFRNFENRVIFGGGRNLDFKGEETTEFGTSPIIQNELKHLLNTVILPNTHFEIEQTWSGIMAFGKELEPIIQEVNPNVFCAVRGSGMGVAIGTLTGQEIAEMILNSF